MSFDLFVEIMQDRRGESKAITLANIAQRLGVSRRKVESLIEANYSEMPWPICSGAKGMFIPVSVDELNHYDNSLRSRIKCIAGRRRSLIAVAIRAGWVRDSAGRKSRFVDNPAQLHLDL